MCGPDGFTHEGHCQRRHEIGSKSGDVPVCPLYQAARSGEAGSFFGDLSIRRPHYPGWFGLVEPLFEVFVEAL
jgi:hypothetical protein